MRVSATPGKFGYSYSHLSLETVFPAFMLTQNCYVHTYKNIFFLRIGNLILNWVPLSFSYNHPMPERLSCLSFPTLQRIGNNLEAQARLMLNKAIFHLFSLNWEVQPQQHTKILKSLCKLGKTWKYSLRRTPKNSNFESTDELGKVRS